MTDRIFKQHAQGYGSDSCQVICTIDGNTIFSGEVASLDAPVPVLPNPEVVVNNVAWSWTQAADFAGTQQITISVNGSDLLLAETLANDPIGNVDIFDSFYNQEIDGVIYSDPFTDEKINGIMQSGPYNPNIPGQWWWRIPAGSTFSATMHVVPARPLRSELPPSDPEPETPPE